MALPEILYLAMGAIIARILLENVFSKGFSEMQWSQVIFEVLRIVVLWPLVLFLRTFESWLREEGTIN